MEDTPSIILHFLRYQDYLFFITMAAMFYTYRTCSIRGRLQLSCQKIYTLLTSAN